MQIPFPRPFNLQIKAMKNPQSNPSQVRNEARKSKIGALTAAQRATLVRWLMQQQRAEITIAKDQKNRRTAANKSKARRMSGSDLRARRLLPTNAFDFTRTPAIAINLAQNPG
ncbi:MAG: hypothetical protein P4N60_18520 [Verrucomicrobiae bacterium]|nr:hypothetical protein [Verrucomicrobiae bacterium]